MNKFYSAAPHGEFSRFGSLAASAEPRLEAALRPAVRAVSTFAIVLGTALPLSSEAYVSGAGAIEGNERNTVIGDGARGPDGSCALAFGVMPLCSTVIGNEAAAESSASVVIGDNAFTGGAYSVAVGALAHADSYGLAIGGATKAGDHATAIAYGAHANAPYSLAIGEASGADADESVALGAHSRADRAMTVSVGNDEARRQIVNVAPGTQASDAVTVEQLAPGVAALGGGASFDSSTGAVTGPVYHVQGGTQTNVGSALDALDAGVKHNKDEIRKLGVAPSVPIEDNVSVKYDVGRDGFIDFGSVTLGGVGFPPATLTNVADGAQRYDAVNFGQLSDLKSQLLTEIGQIDQRVTVVESGQGNALPSAPVESASPWIDATPNTPGAQPAGASAGSGAGSLAAGDGAQSSGLHATAIGASSRVAANDGTAIGAGASVTAGNAVALGAGSVADRANTVSVGSTGNERQVTHVAAGTAATDAVNVGQLQAASAQSTALAQAYTDSQVQAANRRIDERFNATEHAIQSVAKTAYAGIAGAMAMPNLTPSQPGRTIVAAGAATYHGGHAIAAGVTYRSRDAHWLVNTALSLTSTGDTGVRAQVGYEF
jgi:trimeric autotransporter adhesin